MDPVIAALWGSVQEYGHMGKREVLQATLPPVLVLIVTWTNRNSMQQLLQRHNDILLSYADVPSLDIKPSLVQTLANTQSLNIDLSKITPWPVREKGLLEQTRRRLHCTCLQNVPNSLHICHVALIQNPQLQLEGKLVWISIKFF